MDKLACSNSIINNYKHNSAYNWKYLAKNFNTISDNPIAKNNFLKFNLYISALDYLEDRSSCFMKSIENEDETEKEQDNKL